MSDFPQLWCLLVDVHCCPYRLTFLQHTYTLTFLQHTYTLTFLQHTYRLTFLQHTYTLTFLEHTYTMTFIQHTYTLTFLQHTSSQGVWFMFHIMFWQFEWMNMSLTFSTEIKYYVVAIFVYDGMQSCFPSTFSTTTSAYVKAYLRFVCDLLGKCCLSSSVNISSSSYIAVDIMQNSIEIRLHSPMFNFLYKQ